MSRFAVYARRPARWSWRTFRRSGFALVKLPYSLSISRGFQMVNLPSRVRLRCSMRIHETSVCGSKKKVESKRCPLKAFGSCSHPSCGGWAIGDVRRWAQCLSTCRVWRSSYGRSTRRNPCGRSTRRNPWGGIRAKRDTRLVVEPGRCLFMGTAPG